ncbi:hypothetical protein MUN82_01920 [Hymenobacter aerilatus]|uniref:Uncharacterized protein n=1 Tax=Hymenobacter aerilatus TaxID=2932251 RepID=A0A8T9SUU7_9BACT|nr:hypothetical protein [Hymenobacter aerilatus]UOR05868.1 hypothetical protein MUN82_01920 [Hymenobacter aerilatus]
MGWDEYDRACLAFQYKEQSALVGPRMVATQIYNLLAEKGKSIKETDYYYLPLIDKKIESDKVESDEVELDEMETESSESMTEFLDRMEKMNYHQKATDDK